MRHVYEDLPTYQLIDSNIAHGNPVIVRVRLASGITHFVVIAGKDGFDYLVRDPGAGSAKGIYPLRELGSDIEALRFYQPIANPNFERRSAALITQPGQFPFDSDLLFVVPRKTPQTVSRLGRCLPVSFGQSRSVEGRYFKQIVFAALSVKNSLAVGLSARFEHLHADCDESVQNV